MSGDGLFLFLFVLVQSGDGLQTGDVILNPGLGDPFGVLQKVEVQTVSAAEVSFATGPNRPAGLYSLTGGGEVVSSRG